MVMHHNLWPDAPEHPILTPGEAHIWCAYLNQDCWTIEFLADVLSPDEHQRADRYCYKRDREHFKVARGILRTILSRYVKIPPRQLRFSHNQYNKPTLIHETHDNLLHFNISHSQSVALFAITGGLEVGIDIEFVREDFASLEIAERFFSPAEVAMLRALAPDSQTAAFFNCWTRKEAYIKARGEGLSRPLDQFTVSLVPGEPAALLMTDDDPQEASRWSLIELSPAQGYRAALVVEGSIPVLHCWQFTLTRGSIS